MTFFKFVKLLISHGFESCLAILIAYIPVKGVKILLEI
jgi:hypothetical protein